MREAPISARLNHPNITPVYKVGTLYDGDAQRHHISMRYIDGETFDRVAPRLPLRDTLALFRTACLAVCCAHEQGVVHPTGRPGACPVESGH